MTAKHTKNRAGRSWKRQVAALALGAGIAVTPAHADNAVRPFDIPAGALATALNRLAESAGLQLVYDAAIAEG